ncbi:MAG: hypothetical protein EOO13_09980 [Chitinophagaceae bacterium]|nr:MAG: hypothetical protein EOO13_09980 [Chitinophagaceae bacterium]
MKKLLLLLMVASVGLTADAVAQGRGNGNGKAKKYKKHQQQNDRYDNGRYDNDRNDDRYDNDRNNRNDDYGNKYSKNAPRKVTDAFYRDYPNAGNVSWTKDRGVWTANFKRGGIFGGNNRVSYRANGQRIDNYNNNTTARRSTQDRNTQTNGQQRPTVFGKNKGIYK